MKNCKASCFILINGPPTSIESCRISSPFPNSNEVKRTTFVNAVLSSLMSTCDKHVREERLGWFLRERKGAKEKTVAGLWANLERLYMTKSLANRLYIKKKMFSLRMIKEASLDEHIDEFNKVCDELETIDEGLSDESKALLLISSLPKLYEHFVDASLYERQTLSLEEVKSALGTKKLKDKQDKPESELSEGLVARSIFEKRENKGKKQGRSKSKQKHLKCFHYHKEGHFKKDFHERKSKQKEPKDKSRNAAIATKETSFETIEVLIATKEKPQGQWVLDSGCTFHMSANRSYFTTYQSYDGGMILMGNNSVCKVVGIGTVSLKMYNGMVRELTQVRHVPELKSNMISIGMLDQIGCVIKAEKRILKVVKGSIIIMKGTKLNGLYVLNGQTTVGEASVIENSEDKARLWHLRLGHMSERGLKELQKKGVFGSDKLNSLGFCKDCVIGTAFRLKFESTVHSTKEKLAYLHSNLWRPAKVNSLGGCRVADYSKLRIFGCVAYAHVKQGKLEPRALKCRFLGYPDGVKGYRLWCINLKPPKCITSGDVTFNESEILNKSKTTESKEYRSETRPGSVQFEVESHEQEKTELVIEEDAGSVADGSDDVQGSASTKSEGDSYQLVRDRKRRVIRPPKSEFDMKDLGAARKILGIEIIKDRRRKLMFLTQQSYVKKVLVRFGMYESKSVQTPLANHCKLSAAQCPQTDAEQDKMASLPYSSVVGGLMKGASWWVMLTRDFVGDLDKMRSQTGFLFTLGGCTVNWKATLQNVVALSTTETEYTTAAEAFKEAIWLKGMVSELVANQETI
ncbi:Integrase catalytic domain-containing protein [Citrus sinensis]|uniref:Integrase catalytic domain-containing protein n=1 Tax=Citrus sinensis TaxID=2711 RepID=A0ACB8KA17_CITSI|nr:Integrase catalytic domain-containing protein [Citrus sinensis]